MTLLKGENPIAQRARPFRLPTAAAERIDRDLPDQGHQGRGPAEDMPRDGFDASARIAELETALREASRERINACAEAEKRGFAKGAEEAASFEQKRTDALRTALADAVAALDRRIGDERDLAVEIAQDALERLFVDAGSYRTMVIATATLHAQSLRSDAVVRLRVSEADFPDPEALECLGDDALGFSVARDPRLAAGGCVFDLTLGTLDASIPVQAAAVQRVLDEARRPGTASP